MESDLEPFVPLRKKQKRASTGLEDNFVPSYMPPELSKTAQSRELFEKASTRHDNHKNRSACMELHIVIFQYACSSVCKSQVTECRVRYGIEVSGEGCSPPVQEFADLQLPQHAVTELQQLGHQASRKHFFNTFSFSTLLNLVYYAEIPCT